MLMFLSFILLPYFIAYLWKCAIRLVYADVGGRCSPFIDLVKYFFKIRIVISVYGFDSSVSFILHALAIIFYAQLVRVVKYFDGAGERFLS